MGALPGFLLLLGAVWLAEALLFLFTYLLHERS